MCSLCSQFLNKELNLLDMHIMDLAKDRTKRGAKSNLSFSLTDYTPEGPCPSQTGVFVFSSLPQVRNKYCVYLI